MDGFGLTTFNRAHESTKLRTHRFGQTFIYGEKSRVFLFFLKILR